MTAGNDALERQRPMLRERLERLELDVSEGAVTAIVDFLKELQLWNRRYSLVRATEEELITRHVLDSLAPVHLVRREWDTLGSAGSSILDLGSGAGFPGVPLAVVAGLPMTLLDRSSRAASFLRAAVARLGIENCAVLEADAATLSQRFPLVVSRALSPGGRAGLSAMAGLLPSGGRAIVYSGTRDSAEGLVQDGADLFAAVAIDSVNVPFLEAPRHVVVLEKV